VADLASLAAERDLLAEAVDRLTGQFAAAEHRADTATAALLAEQIRARMTWHAVRVTRRALVGEDAGPDLPPPSCPVHVRQWRGDCPACERGRLVDRARTALRALDRPIPTPPD